MSYQEQADLYRNGSDRTRFDICVREQGFIFSTNSDPSVASLGQGVVAGNLTDIDAVIAAICVSPSWADLAEDPALLAAVQQVWPTVAAARYPQPAAQ